MKLALCSSGFKTAANVELNQARMACGMQWSSDLIITRIADKLVRDALADRGVPNAEIMRVTSSTVIGTPVSTRTKIVHLSPGLPARTGLCAWAVQCSI